MQSNSVGRINTVGDHYASEATCQKPPQDCSSSLDSLGEGNDKSFFRKVWDGFVPLLKWIFCCGCYRKEPPRTKETIVERMRKNPPDFDVPSNFDKLFLIVKCDGLEKSKEFTRGEQVNVDAFARTLGEPKKSYTCEMFYVSGGRLLVQSYSCDGTQFPLTRAKYNSGLNRIDPTQRELLDTLNQPGSLEKYVSENVASVNQNALGEKIVKSPLCLSHFRLRDGNFTQSIPTIVNKVVVILKTLREQGEHAHYYYRMKLDGRVKEGIVEGNNTRDVIDLIADKETIQSFSCNVFGLDLGKRIAHAHVDCEIEQSGQGKMRTYVRTLEQRATSTDIDYLRLHLVGEFDHE